jgi:SAM-dependent methyltransferase
MSETREPQYRLHFDVLEQAGRCELGLGANATWNIDPARLTFVLSRYKFVAKMLDGMQSVLEIGCGDGFASRIVRQYVKSLTVSDFDPVYVAEAAKQLRGRYAAETLVHDFVVSSLERTFDAIYALDVLEHIPSADEDIFMTNLTSCLAETGVTIIGIPSLDSQRYASPGSAAGHVNCKTGPELKSFLKRFFSNVFVFSMNDEVVHTGFAPLAHYFLALCTCPKRRSAEVACRATAVREKESPVSRIEPAPNSDVDVTHDQT